MQHSVKVIAVTGPTATGKTRLAVRLAGSLNGEIISVDSRQVYRGMDLGTGKDLADYGSIPYHLIDIADPMEEYNLYYFLRDAAAAVQDIVSRGKQPILCGGTALYLAAFLQDYQLENFHLPFKADTLTLGVYYPRATVRARIAQRMDTRFEDGMIDEVRRLRENGVTWERLESFGLEYREIARHLQGKTSREEMRELLLNSIRQFAKRQDIFFRKMEREGVVIHWLREGDPEQAEKLCHLHLAGEPLPPPEFQMCDIHYPRISG